MRQVSLQDFREQDWTRTSEGWLVVDTGPVNGKAGHLQFLRQVRFLSAMIVKILPDDPYGVGRKLDIASFQRTDLVTTQLADEKSPFENDVLTRSMRRRVPRWPANRIVRRKENNRKSHFAVGFKLLDDRVPAIGLLMQDDGFEFDPLKKTSESLFGGVVTMDDENPSFRRRFCHGLLWC